MRGKEPSEVRELVNGIRCERNMQTGLRGEVACVLMLSQGSRKALDTLQIHYYIRSHTMESNKRQKSEAITQEAKARRFNVTLYLEMLRAAHETPMTQSELAIQFQCHESTVRRSFAAGKEQLKVDASYCTERRGIRIYDWGFLDVGRIAAPQPIQARYKGVSHES